jgi:predicted nuclease with TOPRIM domain
MSVKKIGDDPRLRPFLNSHFDPQTYIKNVIKEGRSEECFKEIGTCIEEVNEEIKGYISQHKDDLMSGMQDVAMLAERYLQLQSHSQKLNKTIDRLKKEVEYLITF